MSLNSGDFVMPGDILAVSEQYLPMDWAYEEDGYIKSSVVGVVSFDDGEHEVCVSISPDEPAVLKRGDVVIGEITALRGQRVMVKIHTMKGNPRGLATSYSGAIHISQVKDGYLSKLTDAFRIGDIIEAEVTKVLGDNVDLKTSKRDLGVLKAMCTRCRAFMKTTGKDYLKCPRCEKKEKREISVNYVG